MYYLVIENLGKKKCIDKNESDIYKDGQIHNCLRKLTFDEDGKEICGMVKIRCVADPGKQITATVFCDDE
jgi:hypothetical protein